MKYSKSLPILLSTVRSYCLFCDTSSVNMIKHLEDKHAGEGEVQEAIRMPREFDAGKRLWSRLITRGNKEHNDRAMQAGRGELIPLKRFQGLATLQNYQFCFSCYMFIRKSQTMHKFFCKKSRRTFDDSEKEDLVRYSYLLLNNRVLEIFFCCQSFGPTTICQSKEISIRKKPHINIKFL